MVAAPRITVEDRVRIPAAAFEHAGFRSWLRSDTFPSGISATFVAGEVLIEMSPESIESHNKVKLEISSVLGQLVRDQDLGEAFADRALLTLPLAATTTEPDFSFVSWGSSEQGRVRLVERAARADDYIELEGAPDLVVEIVSDSSVRKDLELLRDAYARQGIPEYWIVDARGEVLSFQILSLANGTYVSQEGTLQTSRVLARSFSLTRTRNRAQRWTYRLT